jgi:hypothetical protein
LEFEPGFGGELDGGGPPGSVSSNLYRTLTRSGNTKKDEDGRVNSVIEIDENRIAQPRCGYVENVVNVGQIGN